MMSQPETDPLQMGPPIKITADDRKTLFWLGLASSVVAVLMLLGLRCAIHKAEWALALLTS